MGLIDLFNQWIVERGSAAVQEKHLSLFRDQLIAADKQISILTTENNNLKSTIGQVTRENEALKQEMQRRDDITHDKKSHSSLLEELEIDILRSLFKQDNPTEALAQLLKVELQIMKFHLLELKNKNMIRQKRISYGFGYGSGSVWTLAQEGRRYLIENKLTS